ncbi:MAG: acyl transferase [Bacteroidota bacterium]
MEAKPLINQIFSIKTSDEFKQLALAVFKYQSKENKVYRNYIDALKINPDLVSELEDIPFMPIEFFKSHILVADPQFNISNAQVFTSSGIVKSKHYVTNTDIYERSYLDGFKHFYGNVEEYCILALLPSYLEREGSSLIYMAEDLIKKSRDAASGFYLDNYEELITQLKLQEQKKQKTILLGVTYALLDLIEREKFQLKHTIIMETGGMKGKRQEMVREELHTVLCEGFGVDVIHSEYGMTELLSQGYSKGKGIFNCPPWLKIVIRDTNDPFAVLMEKKTGGVNIIDLANLYSCSFIATQDLGKCYADHSFEIMGRFDNSDIRGCNLLVQ